jgi:hypothetical protein
MSDCFSIHGTMEHERDKTMKRFGLVIGSLFLIALAQLDGAGAYLGHGPKMHITSVAMFACAGICLIDGLFSIMGSYLKWKAQHRQAA